MRRSAWLPKGVSRETPVYVCARWQREQSLRVRVYALVALAHADSVGGKRTESYYWNNDDTRWAVLSGRSASGFRSRRH